MKCPVCKNKCEYLYAPPYECCYECYKPITKINLTKIPNIIVFKNTPCLVFNYTEYVHYGCYYYLAEILYKSKKIIVANNSESLWKETSLKAWDKIHNTCYCLI